jgi:hypothetical protein
VEDTQEATSKPDDEAKEISKEQFNKTMPIEVPSAVDNRPNHLNNLKAKAGQV